VTSVIHRRRSALTRVVVARNGHRAANQITAARTATEEAPEDDADNQ
jgi:hypothetical protein